MTKTSPALFSHPSFPSFSLNQLLSHSLIIVFLSYHTLYPFSHLTLCYPFTPLLCPNPTQLPHPTLTPITLTYPFTPHSLSLLHHPIFHLSFTKLFPFHYILISRPSLNALIPFTLFPIPVYCILSNSLLKFHPTTSSDSLNLTPLPTSHITLSLLHHCYFSF